MRTFISLLDPNNGNLSYVKYYVSIHEFGVSILARYIARFVLCKPLDECRDWILSKIFISRSSTRCYFEYDNKIFAANMTQSNIDFDRIIMSFPMEKGYTIAINDEGEEQDL